jgi:hypothetical protein
MKGFILGFQRLVWCPKWTPESSNSLMPILITIFLLLEARAGASGTNHPAEHGIELSVIMAAHPHTGTDLKPLPKGDLRPKGQGRYQKFC